MDGEFPAAPAEGEWDASCLFLSVILVVLCALGWRSLRGLLFLPYTDLFGQTVCFTYYNYLFNKLIIVQSLKCSQTLNISLFSD